MRVLHVTPFCAPAYSYGGPIRSIEGRVSALSSLGVEQRIITTNADGRRTLDVSRGWIRRDGALVKYLRRWARPDITPCTLSEVGRWSDWADVVHVAGVFYVPSILGLLAARVASKPIVLSVQGALQPTAMETGTPRKRAWLQMFAGVYRDVAAYHATAEHEALAIRNEIGSRSQVVVIPNGTHPLSDEEVRTLRERTPCDRRVIGMLGRLHPIKAVDRVLEAVALLHRRGIRARLEFAGPIQEPDYRDMLVKQANRLGLSGDFQLRGPLYGAEQLQFYARCGLLVVASHSENFGNVVVEALNVETPVIASLGTPWAELPEAGCGAWVENRPESLADTISRFLCDPDAQRRAGVAGRRLVKEKYTWPSVARRLLEAYDWVIQRHRGNRK